MTTILGCVPNHTFYNQIINALPVFARIYSNKVQRATGPWFLDGQYRSYMKRKKGTKNLSSKDGCSVGQESITVAESDLFLPTFDETQVIILHDYINLQILKYINLNDRHFEF